MFDIPGTELLYLTADAVCIALGLLIWVKDPKGWPSRIFATYLILRGLDDMALSLSLTATDGGLSWTWAMVQSKIIVPAAIFLIALVFLYPRPLTRARPSTVFLGALAASLAWIAIVTFWPDAYATFVPDPAGGPAILHTTGPLFVAAIVASLMEILVPLVLISQARHMAGAHAKSMTAIIIGLGLNMALYTGQAPFGIYWAAAGLGDFYFLEVIQMGFSIVAFAAGGWIVYRALSLAPMTQAPRQMQAIGISFALVAFLEFFFTSYVASGWPGAPVVAVIQTYFYGVVWLLLPLLTSYAFLRYGLFNIDLKVKFALTQSTIATVFAVLFFVLSEMVEQAFNTTTTTAGIMTAAAIALAFRPIQLGATTLVNKVMPNVKSMTEMTAAEAERFYEEQVALAWEDAHLGNKERQLLQNVRERLRLDIETAARIEAKVGCIPVHVPGGQSAA